MTRQQEALPVGGSLGGDFAAEAEVTPPER
jgi:hypothetical protein